MQLKSSNDVHKIQFDGPQKKTTHIKLSLDGMGRIQILTSNDKAN